MPSSSPAPSFPSATQVRSRFHPAAPKIASKEKFSSASSMEISIPFHAQYRVMLPLTLGLLLLETLIWRHYRSIFCGSLCSVTYIRVSG